MIEYRGLVQSTHSVQVSIEQLIITVNLFPNQNKVLSFMQSAPLNVHPANLHSPLNVNTYS